MPVFAKDGIKKLKRCKKLDDQETKKIIEEKVKKFEIYMTSGSYHALGGCEVPVINDGGDCGACPTEV